MTETVVFSDRRAHTAWPPHSVRLPHSVQMQIGEKPGAATPKGLGGVMHPPILFSNVGVFTLLTPSPFQCIGPPPPTHSPSNSWRRPCYGQHIYAQLYKPKVGFILRLHIFCFMV